MILARSVFVNCMNKYYMSGLKLLNLKERYPFTCECGLSIEVAPSVFMSGFQTNMGGIFCPNCKDHVLIKIDDTNTHMVSDENRMTGAALPSACYRDATPDEEKKINERKKKHSNQQAEKS